MPVLYTSEQVADIVRMAIERDRHERGALGVMSSPAPLPKTAPDQKQLIAPLSLAEFTLTEEQQNKQRDAIRTKALR